MRKIITLIRAHGLLNRAHGLLNHAHGLIIRAHGLIESIKSCHQAIFSGT